MSLKHSTSFETYDPHLFYTNEQRQKKVWLDWQNSVSSELQVKTSQGAGRGIFQLGY